MMKPDPNDLQWDKPIIMPSFYKPGLFAVYALYDCKEKFSLVMEGHGKQHTLRQRVSSFCHLPAVWSQANYLTYLSLPPLCSKMGNNRIYLIGFC